MPMECRSLHRHREDGDEDAEKMVPECNEEAVAVVIYEDPTGKCT